MTARIPNLVQRGPDEKVKVQSQLVDKKKRDIRNFFKEYHSFVKTNNSRSQLFNLLIQELLKELSQNEKLLLANRLVPLQSMQNLHLALSKLLGTGEISTMSPNSSGHSLTSYEDLSPVDDIVMSNSVLNYPLNGGLLPNQMPYSEMNHLPPAPRLPEIGDMIFSPSMTPLTSVDIESIFNENPIFARSTVNSSAVKCRQDSGSSTALSEGSCEVGDCSDSVNELSKDCRESQATPTNTEDDSTSTGLVEEENELEDEDDSVKELFLRLNKNVTQGKSIDENIYEIREKEGEEILERVLNYAHWEEEPLLLLMSRYSSILNYRKTMLPLLQKTLLHLDQQTRSGESVFVKLLQLPETGVKEMKTFLHLVKDAGLQKRCQEICSVDSVFVETLELRERQMADNEMKLNELKKIRKFCLE